MKIIIETVKHEDQRYKTVGDWQYIGDELIIRISETGNRVFNSLLAIHELTEAILCRENGVSEQSVDEWDMDHLDDADPGSIENCPYKLEHNVATEVEEHIIVNMKNLAFYDVWKQYEAKLREMN